MFNLSQRAAGEPSWAKPTKSKTDWRQIGGEAGGREAGVICFWATEHKKYKDISKGFV